MGSPISPLGNVTNPLGDVITGMLQGHQLALQMQQQQNANADEQLRQALGQRQLAASDQAAQKSDFDNSMEFMNHTRRMNSAGQVLRPATDPRVIDAINGAQGTPDGEIPGGTPAAAPTTAPTPAATPAATPVATPAPDPVAAPPAAPTAGPAPAVDQPPPENNDPQAQGNVAPPLSPQAKMLQDIQRQGGLWMPADKSMIATFKDRNGNTFTGERLSPQEEYERQLAADLAKRTQDAGIIDAKDLPDVQRKMQDNQMVDDPSNPGKKIRQGELLEAMKVAEAAREHKATEADVQTGQANALKIAADRLAAEKAERDAAEAGRNARATDRNKTILMKGAGKPGAGAGVTANGAAVQGRFDQREIDADTKTMEAAKTKQAAADARRSEIGAATGTEDGEDYADPLSATGKTLTMNTLQRVRLKAEYDKSTTLRDQSAAEVQRIMTKHGWGTPATPTPPAANPPATPAAKPTAAAPPAKLSGVRINVQVTMPDGSKKSGSIDKSQFDPKTMKQVGQ